MKSSTAKILMAISSIVFASLALLVAFDDQPKIWAIAIVIAIMVLVSGIILINPALNKVDKPLIITFLSVYSLFALIALVLLFSITFMGLLVLGMVVVPIVFAILFLVFKDKETNYVSSQSSY